MLNLKDYGSSSDDDGTSEGVSSETTMDSSINVNELNKKFAVNAAPDVLPPVSNHIYNSLIYHIN